MLKVLGFVMRECFFGFFYFILLFDQRNATLLIFDTGLWGLLLSLCNCLDEFRELI